MTIQHAAAESFQTLHQRGEPFIIPNPGDAGTARLLARAGFEALATSSAAVALSMGVDEPRVARETMLRHVAEIAAATALPVSADLRDGFGQDPETVAETIRLAASAGAVGGSIEDSSGDPDSPLLPFTLSVERVVAAVEAARSLAFPFTLTARAEHYLVGCNDLDGVLARFEAYREAGADVLFAPCLPDERAIAAAVEVAAPRPLNVLAQGRGVASSFDRLSALGVRRISIGSGLTRLAFASVATAIEELTAGGFGFLGRAIPLAAASGLFAAGAGTEEAVSPRKIGTVGRLTQSRRSPVC
jgi:2-methylisocitrate lyase-like PEP mutase family enzyme